MLTGKQKAQLLVSLLKDKSQKVLNKLSPESATFLTSSIEDTPETNPELIDELITEILEKIEHLDNQPENEHDIDDFSDSVETDFNFDDHTDDPEEIIEEQSEPIKTTSEDKLNQNDTSNLLERTDPFEIADILSKQKPQIIAFFLSKLPEEIKENISEALPFDIKSDIDKIVIEKTPISEMVYKNLYDTLIEEIKNSLDENNSQDSQPEDNSLLSLSNTEPPPESLYENKEPEPEPEPETKPESEPESEVNIEANTTESENTEKALPDSK